MKTTCRPLLLAIALMGTLSLSSQDLLTTQAPLPCVGKTFTIVAHIVLDSLGEANITEGAIQSAVDGLNEEFEPICIDFKICEFNYIENFQYDEIGELSAGPPKMGEMFAIYDRAKRLNVYLMEGPEEADACGINTGSPTSFAPSIVLLKRCPGAIVHEVGHFFGLAHTFAGSDGPNPELVDGSNCATAGDGICDTPADPYVAFEDMEFYIGDDCRFISLKRDANGDYFIPDVGNIMSYYPCSCGFTHGQYLRMATNYLNNPGAKVW